MKQREGENEEEKNEGNWEIIQCNRRTNGDRYNQ